MMKIVDESILFFSRVSFSKFSGNSLHFVSINVLLKDMSMERVRVEEFGESNDENCG